MVEEGALAGRGDALIGGSMGGGAGKKRLDGNLNALVGVTRASTDESQNIIDFFYGYV